jgi:hypothetical protein
MVQNKDALPIVSAILLSQNGNNLGRQEPPCLGGGVRRITLVRALTHLAEHGLQCRCGLEFDVSYNLVNNSKNVKVKLSPLTGRGGL